MSAHTTAAERGPWPLKKFALRIDNGTFSVDEWEKRKMSTRYRQVPFEGRWQGKSFCQEE